MILQRYNLRHWRNEELAKVITKEIRVGKYPLKYCRSQVQTL